MSLAKKEEVCSHQLVPRLGEPAVGVPIKKRPVLLSDRSVASSMPLSIKPPSPALEMPVSASGAACRNESFFNISKSDTNAITKGKGITDTQIQEHANRSFTTLLVTNGHRGLFNASVRALLQRVLQGVLRGNVKTFWLWIYSYHLIKMAKIVIMALL